MYKRIIPHLQSEPRHCWISRCMIALVNGVLHKLSQLGHINDMVMIFMFVVFQLLINHCSEETRQNLHDNYEEEFDKRFVGSKSAID